MSSDSDRNSDADGQSQLELQAFRYVAGEMTASELQQFERQLADDQSAREAVARTVLVGQAISLSAPPFAPAGRSAAEADIRSRAALSRKPGLWMVAALSAAIAFLAGWGISRWLADTSPAPPRVASQPSDSDSPLNAPRGTTAGRVLALWSESAAAFHEADGLWQSEIGTTPLAEADNGEANATLSLSADSWSTSLADVEGEAEFDVPGWLLAAVAPEDEPEADPAPEED